MWRASRARVGQDRRGDEAVDGADGGARDARASPGTASPGAASAVRAVGPVLRVGDRCAEQGRGKPSLLLGRGLGGLALLLGLGHRLDDADGDRLAHVADGEAAERRVLRERLDAEGLRGREGGHARVAGLDELGVLLEHLAGAAVHLLVELLELARDVGRVAVEHGRVARRDLAGVVHDDDLGEEGVRALGRVLLGVAAHEAAAEVLDGDVLHVEAHVVAGHGLGERLVVHLDGLDLRGELGRRERDDHAGLEHARLDAADGHGADAADLVDVLEREAEGLLRRALRGVAVVEGLEEVGALVPAHVRRLVDHVVARPAGDGDEGDLHGLVADLLEVAGHLLLDLLVAGLAVLDGHVVHLVARDDHLLDAEREREERVLARLAVLGDAGLEAAHGRVDHEDRDVRLGRARDHVLDEVAVAGRVDDREVELGRLELPEGDVDRDAALALGLEVVEHPRVLEGRLAELGRFLLELLDGTLVDAAALVDQVAGGRRLAGIDVADDDEVDVSLLLNHLD
mmetsp:Transcript_17299/g.56315  ORF Transcript_17299/g.56315 Transcript_17299/m.56315 type:complete len:515 (-) Transcript_17299:50-1594(-)